MGTSLPECAVSVTASLAGNNTLAVSNVVGSNIFNLMVVCGACALFAPLTIKKDTLVKEFPLSIICSVLLIALGYVGMKLGHIDGIVFIILFAGYLVWMINSVKKARAVHKEDELMKESGEYVEDEIRIIPMWKSILFIVGGMIAIKFGGDFVVDSASDIFNILLVLGIAAAISPVGFLMDNIVDTLILIIMSSAVLVFAWTSKVINRKEGIAMLCMYAVYMVYICMR